MMNKLWSQVENSQQLAPLPRKAAMIQNKHDQHLAAYQNELSKSSMEWSLEISNTKMWSGMGLFIMTVVAFAVFLINKGKVAKASTRSGMARNNREEERGFTS